MTYETRLPCPIPGCSRLHGVRAIRSSKRGPARPYTGPVTSPLRHLAEGPTVPGTSGPALGEQAERSASAVP